MKPLSLPWAALVLSGVMMGQTAKQPEKAASPAPDTFLACDKDHTKDCISVGFASPNDHGCGWNKWDVGKQACTIYATFGSDLPPVTCSPVATSPDGTQHMICWYTPKPATKEKP